MKYRLSVLTPADKWYPVIKRYIEILSGRIDGHGGVASEIPPSATGLGGPPPRKGGKGCKHHHHCHCHCHDKDESCGHGKYCDCGTCGEV